MPDRKLLITGTDAPAIVGVGFRTPCDVWVAKKHPELVAADDSAVERMYWGNVIEPVIAARYAETRGVEIEKPGLMIHGQLKWLGGSPDYLVKSRPVGLECKNVSSWARNEWGSPGTDEIPMQYLIQCVHYMMLTGLEEWEVAALFDGNTMRVYHVFADVDLQGMLLEAEDRFFRQYIVGNDTPELETSGHLREYILRRYPFQSYRKIEVDPYGDLELKEALRVLRTSKVLTARYKGEFEQAKTRVMAVMKDAGELHWTDEEMKISWKQSRARNAVAWQALAEELLASSTMPAAKKKALIDKHTAEKDGSRRFLITDKKAPDGEDTE